MPYTVPSHMRAHLTRDILHQDLSQSLTLLHVGKVRNTYSVPGFPNMLLLVASNRISVFDYNTGSDILGKGALLTAIQVYWLTQGLEEVGFNHHLQAFGADVDSFLPHSLRNRLDLQARSIIVKKLKMIPVEYVYRQNLTGSGWVEYQASNGVVCGNQLPPGLHDGSKLPGVIFTPTTKSEKNDMPLPADVVRRQYGDEAVDLGLRLFAKAAAWASEVGLILADTKLEFGYDENNQLCLGDEAFTPDSSRLWDYQDWLKAIANRRSPAGYDKQFVREVLKKIPTSFTGMDGKELIGLNSLKLEDPRAEQFRAFAGTVQLSDDVVRKTQELYETAFFRLVGKTLLQFQRENMGIAL